MGEPQACWTYTPWPAAQGWYDEVGYAVVSIQWLFNALAERNVQYVVVQPTTADAQEKEPELDAASPPKVAERDAELPAVPVFPDASMLEAAGDNHIAVVVGDTEEELKAKEEEALAIVGKYKDMLSELGKAEQVVHDLRAVKDRLNQQLVDIAGKERELFVEGGGKKPSFRAGKGANKGHKYGWQATAQRQAFDDQRDDVHAQLVVVEGALQQASERMGERAEEMQCLKVMLGKVAVELRQPGAGTGSIDEGTDSAAIDDMYGSLGVGPSRNKDFEEKVSRISFLFSRGGQVYAETFFGSLNLKTPSFALAGFGLWAAIVAIITFQQCVSLMRAVKKGDCCSYLLKLLNLYEWTLLITAWLIVLMIVLGVLGMNNFDSLFDNYSITRATTSRITIQDFDRSWYKKLHDVAERLVRIDGNATWFVAYFHIMIVIRFFIASRGHVRLAIVVNTLGHGVDDLLHLFVVFAVIFSSFVMAGHILFGHRMEPFATVKGSLGYCAQIVLQHQYDSNAIAEEDYWTSTFWTCIFVVLVVLVVVNIVLAMIFDSYGEAMMEIHPKDTIWHTAWYLWTYMRNGASHADLARALKKEGQLPVSAKRLRQICPKVSNEQIDHLYDFAKLRLVTKVANSRKIALAEAMSHILLGINELRYGTYRMIGETAIERPKSTFSTICSEDSSSSSSQAAVVAMPSKLPRATHGPPEKMPLWVEEGLMAHLRKRQSTMDQLFLQLQQIRGEIRKRGLGVNCDPVPREEPEEPSRTGSRRLDQTLTGTEMKPMITPGQERKKGIVHAPRPTQPPSGYSILQRLGRAA